MKDSTLAQLTLPHTALRPTQACCRERSASARRAGHSGRRGLVGGGACAEVLQACRLRCAAGGGCRGSTTRSLRGRRGARRQAGAAWRGTRPGAMGSGGRLAGKRVLLTGASSGLGSHFARLLARSGCAELVLAARRRDRLEALARELALKGASFGPAAPALHVLELDVADPGSVERAFERVDALLRGAAVDVVVNNAGTAGVPKRLLAGAVHDFDAVMATNVRGALLVTQAAARRLIAAKQGGSIVNIASILAAQPSQGNAFYATSKAALVALTRASALELLPHGIRVNAILPGYIQTEMNESFFQSPKGRQFVEERLLPKRLGTPAELHGPLMLLCSDESSFMTGSQLVADGGSLLFPL